MRTVIIGGSHGGTTAAITLRKMDPDMEIILIEEQANISYVSSGVNLLLNGLIEELEESRLVQPSELLDMDVNLLLNTKALDIDSDNKVVKVQYLGNNAEDFLVYDYLILAMGSSQFNQTYQESEFDNIITYKHIEESQGALEKIQNAQSITIIGAGFIGMELANALASTEKRVHIVEQMPNILFRYFDHEMANKIEERIPENIIFHNNTSVLRFEGEAGKVTKVVTYDETFTSDLVIIAVNARPNIDLLPSSIQLTNDGTVEVNEFLQTNYPSIYAIGDMISVPLFYTDRKVYLPLVANAVKSGIVAAENIILHNKVSFGDSLNPTVSKLFGLYVGSSGVTEDEAAFFGIEAIGSTQQYEKGGFDPAYRSNIEIKLVFDRENLRLIGAQVLTDEPALDILNYLSSLMMQGHDLLSLLKVNVYFHPLLTSGMHIIQRLALDTYEELKKTKKI